jgi:arylsulfatase A-like enzyme
MTSTHVRTHGWDFHVPGPQPTGGFCGRSDLPTLAEVLGEQGFSSHAVSLNAFLRVDMGFPRGFGIWNGQDVARLERGEGPDPDRQGVQLFRSVGEAVQGWHDGGRHFLYVHTMHTHLPLDPTDHARERFALPEGGVVRVNDARRMEQDGTPEERSLTRELYHAKAWDADRAIRRIVRTLRSEGLLEDTIVVITADHGELLFDHGDRYGHSSGVWQELARVPLLIRAPGLEPARVGRPVALLDLAPTILGQLGLEAAIPDLWQGIDMFDPEGAAAERPVVTERLGQVAISTDGRMEAMRDEEQRWSLYDLDQDPNERSPLVDRLALDELIEVYRGWEDSVPEGQLDQEAEPVGMCRGELAVKKEAQLTEQLRELGYVE